MICPSCRNRRHEECRGGTWCCCRHRPGRAVERPASAAAAGAERPAEDARPAGAP
ncbi:hypothetical protein [Actinomadura formosensis]|uniref:hypothetical protein n=1 Tax=Actinomadura formosensis TaxID=60706 RepID=UPI003D8BBB0B